MDKACVSNCNIKTIENQTCLPLTDELKISDANESSEEKENGIERAEVGGKQEESLFTKIWFWIIIGSLIILVGIGVGSWYLVRRNKLKQLFFGNGEFETQGPRSAWAP